MNGRPASAPLANSIPLAAYGPAAALASRATFGAVEHGPGASARDRVGSVAPESALSGAFNGGVPARPRVVTRSSRGSSGTSDLDPADGKVNLCPMDLLATAARRRFLVAALCFAEGAPIAFIRWYPRLACGRMASRWIASPG